jgi:tetratricopeptide (TPR) repeat protein
MREEPGTSAEFDSATYVAEVTLKFECAAMLAILQNFDKGEAGRLGFALTDSDGVGIWTDTLQKTINALTVAGKLDTLEFTRSYTQKLSEKRGSDVLEHARNVWSELGESDFSFFSRTRLGIMQFFVALRNRTRGHGATTPSQYEAINGALLELLAWTVQTSPFAAAELLKPMKVKPGGHYSCRLLRGYPSQAQVLVSADVIKSSDDLYIRAGSTYVALPDFMWYVREDDSCFFLNSRRRRGNGHSEFLDYVTNQRRTMPVRWFQSQPAERAASHTAGGLRMDWDSTPINNLPAADFTTYVHRPEIESELIGYLTGKTINFISLAGPGGAGKTTLALRVVRQIINEAPATESGVFDIIIWFSARDTDLDEYAGPLPRKRQVTSLLSCAQMFCDLMSPLYGDVPSEQSPIDFMGERLAVGKEKFLLIFDNFESFDDTPTLQLFIKRHLAHPSKALITSRERAFQGDFPIEVGGLSIEQTRDLIMQTARRAGCEPRIDERVIGRVYDATLGNPYAIKLVVNEYARSSSLEALLPKALTEDYLTALFRRSFERSDDDVQYLFLLIALSPTAHDERMARLLCAGRTIDYNRARDALVENHLLDSPDRSGPEYGFYRVSWAAQQFARQIIVGVRVQRDVERDVRLLKDMAGQGITAENLSTIMQYLDESVDAYDPMDLTAQQRNRRIIDYILSHDANAAAAYATSKSAKTTPEERRAAYKRAVELDATRFSTWISWAAFEQAQGDYQRALDLSLRALDQSDGLNALVEVGRRVVAILTDFKDLVPMHRRPIYTKSVISRLEVHHDDLDANGYFVLAWLYLIGDDKFNAKKCTENGRGRYPENQELARLYSRIQERRRSPRS